MKSLVNSNNYLPVLNGLIGDKLAEKNDAWTIAMSFRVDGKDVSVSELSLARKCPVVFLHGLMADERIWRYFSGFDKGLAPLFVRYNTGLHISENGKLLAELLNSLYARFRFNRIQLLGHSMGGLVLRSACHYGQMLNHAWVKRVKTVFLIAVPNAGAALEKLGHLATSTLTRIARWHLGTVGNLLEQRSNGIKDLRLGSMLDEDWAVNAVPRPAHISVPPLPGVQYHILVGSVSKDEKSMMAKYFGDGLVTQSSAVAATVLKAATVKVFVNTGHNSILKSAEVHRYVHKALGT